MVDSTAPIGAIIVAGLVESLVYPHESGLPLDECFPPGFVTPIPPGTTVKVDDETSVPVAIGMTWDGEAFGPAPAPPPIVPRPRSATTYQLMSAFTDAQWAAYPGPVKARDQRLFSARDTAWPETNPKVARIAAALGITPAAWFDAALDPPAA